MSFCRYHGFIKLFHPIDEECFPQDLRSFCFKCVCSGCFYFTYSFRRLKTLIEFADIMVSNGVGVILIVPM